MERREKHKKGKREGWEGRQSVSVCVCVCVCVRARDIESERVNHAHKDIENGNQEAKKSSHLTTHK